MRGHLNSTSLSPLCFRIRKSVNGFSLEIAEGSRLKLFGAGGDISRTCRTMDPANRIKESPGVCWVEQNRKEYWNVRTFFWVKSLFKHSCLGENSNCLLSVIHFMINLCLCSCHIRKQIQSSIRLLRKGIARSTAGPQQPTLVIESILVWGRRDLRSLVGTHCWGIPRVLPAKILSPCSNVWTSAL